MQCKVESQYNAKACFKISFNVFYPLPAWTQLLLHGLYQQKSCGMVGITGWKSNSAHFRQLVRTNLHTMHKER